MTRYALLQHMEYCGAMAGIEAVYRPIEDATWPTWMEPLRRWAEAAYGDEVHINTRPSAVHLLSQEELQMQRVDEAEDDLAPTLLHAMPASFSSELPVRTAGLIRPRAYVPGWFPLIIRLVDDETLQAERRATLGCLAPYEVRSRVTAARFTTTVGSIVFRALLERGAGRSGPTLGDYIPTQVKLRHGTIH